MAQRWILSESLDQYEQVEPAVPKMNAKIPQEVASSPDPFVAKAVPPLDTIPVVAATVAQVIVAEIGVEKKQFPTAKHLSS